MKKLYLCLILVLLIAAPVYAMDYFSDRMNFPPGESRQHKQTLANTGSDAIEINATVPFGFSASTTDCSLINSTLFSCVIGAGSSKYYKITSPANCAEGTIYKSSLTSNSSFSADFTFVCIPDNKITDCKVEYGHGDANYLPSDQLYISNETATIFNLMRVWNIGHYLVPDEDAINATLQCRYEKYPIRTYGRVEIDYDNSGINGTFLWNEIEGGYWFRIGVVSQDVGGKSNGDYYNISCSDMTYKFTHEQVVANSTTCDLEIRSTEPLSCTYVPHPVFTNKAIITLTNIEKYSVYDLSFSRILNGIEHAETYQQLDSGNSISYVVDNYSVGSIGVFYIPSWYINSLHPVYYEQQLNCTNQTPAVNNPPYLSQSIPDQAWQMNTNNTNAFDLDNYFGDLDGNNLSYYCNNVSDISIIIDSNNLVSFIPDINFTGIRNTTCYASDGINTTASNIFQLQVFNCGDGNIDAGEQCDGSNLNNQTCLSLGYAGGSLTCTLFCTFDTSACTSGGGGGGRAVMPTEEKPEEIPSPKKVKQINLTIINPPKNISLQDKGFVVFAEVKNTGELPLTGVILEINDSNGWDAKDVPVGDIGIGEKRIVEVKFENLVCAYDYIAVGSYLPVNITAREMNVQDTKSFAVSMYIPELTVLTDRNYYFEDDTMRLCIILNNLNNSNRSKLEYEINVYNKEDYIVDILSSYNVPENKFLFVIKDYWIHDVIIVDEYIVRAVLYQRGELFDDRYYVAEANKTVIINGFVEDQILQRENTVYNFRYKEEDHSIFIYKFDENYVYLGVSSYNKEYKIRLLETVYVDLDEDGEDDISLTYLGQKGDKADVRIRLVPKHPVDIGGDSAYYILGLGERTPITLEPSKMHLQLIPIVKYIGILALAVFAIILISRTLYTYYPPEIDKFLNLGWFKKTKKR